MLLLMSFLKKYSEAPTRDVLGAVPYLQDVQSPSHVSTGKSYERFHPVFTYVNSARKQEGYRGPESTNVPRGDKMDCEDQGFETMKEKKGKDGVNNTLLIYRLQNLLWLLGTWASRE